MEWWLIYTLIFGTLIVIMFSGLPVAFAFVLTNLIWGLILWGPAGLQQIILSMFESITIFTLLPVPLFVLMGEVMFHSGLAANLLDTVDKWMGRLPGRLGLVSVASGTILAALTGASMGSIAMLGSTLVPEMERRGYKKIMSLGPIMGSGGLAVMIPPSSLAVLLGALGEISISKLLIAIIPGGLLMAALYAIYIIGRCWLRPELAPSYDVPHISFIEKIAITARYVLPMGIVIFLVIGVMMLGIGTPTEAAATGTLGTYLLAACYGKLNWSLVKKSLHGGLRITAMLFLIVSGATAFSQILSYTGASDGFVKFALNPSFHPMMIMVVMQLVLIFLGMFIGQVPIMLITLPVFMPIVKALGWDPVWFGVLFLINMEVGLLSPPFGMSLFTMKGVAPRDTTMSDIIRSAMPFLYLDLVALALIIIFPGLVLWFPGAS
jgi:tripartite ATP-independent transporter DctM subunit